MSETNFDGDIQFKDEKSDDQNFLKENKKKMTKANFNSDIQFKDENNNANNQKNLKGGNQMKKLTGLLIGCAMIFALTITQVHAQSLGSAIAKGLVGAAAGEVLDDVGRVASSGADWAQESINGGQYSTYIEGDLDPDIVTHVDRVETGQNAFVNIGSVNFNHSRFNDDVELDVDARVDRVDAEDDAFVDVSGITFTQTRVNGETDISTKTRVGRISAGKSTVVTVGSFSAY